MVHHYTFPSVKEGQIPEIWTDYDTVMKAYTVEPYRSEDALPQKKPKTPDDYTGK